MDTQPEPTAEAPKAPPQETPVTNNQVMDVVAPPPADTSTEGKSADKPAEPAPQAKQPAKPAAPKQPGSGVGLAIFATVVIVLGLAALATYAFLQTR